MNTFKFHSLSNPDAEPHVATQFDDGDVICSCPGYKWRGKCRHVVEVKSGEAKAEPGECAEPEDGGDASFDIESFSGEETA